MGIYRIHRRKVLWIWVLLVASLIIGGCAGIEPYEPRNNREEGPEKGLFTGPEGQWVIMGTKAPETDKEDEEHPDKPTDGKQQ